MQWLLFTYRIPAQPSALRVAVWRELRQLGAVGLGSGLYALPDRPEYAQVLIPLTEKITQGGGTAISFRAAALNEADERAMTDAFATARAEDYFQVAKSARKLLAHIDREDGDRDYRFAEVESLEEELDKVRRQLARVVRRDVGGSTARAESEDVIAAAEQRLQEYVEHAYREHDPDAAASRPTDPEQAD